MRLPARLARSLAGGQPSRRVAADGPLSAAHWAGGIGKRRRRDRNAVVARSLIVSESRGTSGARATCARSGARGTRMMREHAARQPNDGAKLRAPRERRRRDGACARLLQRAARCSVVPAQLLFRAPSVQAYTDARRGREARAWQQGSRCCNLSAGRACTHLLPEKNPNAKTFSYLTRCPPDRAADAPPPSPRMDPAARSGAPRPWGGGERVGVSPCPLAHGYSRR